MSHAVLDTIIRNSDDASASIQFLDRRIEILISPDDQPIDVSVELVASVVIRLEQLDETARNDFVVV